MRFPLKQVDDPFPEILDQAGTTNASLASFDQIIDLFNVRFL
jgi:hypothetical protein